MTRIIPQNDVKIIQGLVAVGRHVQQPIAKLPVGVNLRQTQGRAGGRRKKSARSISHSMMLYISGWSAIVSQSPVWLPCTCRRGYQCAPPGLRLLVLFLSAHNELATKTKTTTIKRVRVHPALPTQDRDRFDGSLSAPICSRWELA